MIFLTLLLKVFSISFLASAEQAITVSSGYVKETIPGTTISAAYMTISNKSDQTIKLIGAKSRLSDRIEIHQHLMADGMMKMRQTDFIAIAANEQVKLQPSGYHLMIFDLKNPLSNGETMPITLYFDNQKDVSLNLPIQGLKRKTSHHHH